MSEDICACVSQLICHYFGGALFYTHFLNVFTDYKCEAIAQYENKTKAKQHETFFKKKMNKSLLMYFSSILALHPDFLYTQY